MSDEPRRKRPRRRSKRKVSRPRPALEAVVEIESLAAGGDGVGRLEDGRIAFVRWTAPGDRVQIRYAESKGNFVRGTLSEVLEPGDARVEPECPVFGACGGCAWQHVAYPAQLAAKETIVREALRRIGKLDPLPSIRMIASPQPFGYRARTRLQIRGDKVGYRRWHEHEIEPINHCPILDPALDRALAQLAEHLTSDADATELHEGQQWEIALGSEGRVRSGPVRGPRERRKRAAPTRGFDLAVGEDRVSISHGGFFQGNNLLRDTLSAAVFAGLEGAGSGLVLELYAGAGFFTLGLARLFDAVIAVESDATAVVDMTRNLRRAEVSNVDMRSGLVEDVIEKLGEWRPDAIVLDPPRSGLASGAAKRVAAFEARRIVYLSCDPATLARDLAELVGAGYEVVEIQAFDLFPQTPHVEVLAVLAREDTPLDQI